VVVSGGFFPTREGLVGRVGRVDDDDLPYLVEFSPGVYAADDNNESEEWDFFAEDWLRLYRPAGDIEDEEAMWMIVLLSR
jgi:hypothetical protein